MRLLAIDPGKATGWAMGYYSETEAYELEDVWVTQDGVDGVAHEYWNGGIPRADIMIIERFIVRPNQPVDPVALEVIGFLRGIYETVDETELVWRLRSDKGKAGVMDAVLKKHGLWQTGKMVNHKDGRDANDAIIHSLTWLMFKEKHQPTLEVYGG